MFRKVLVAHRGVSAVRALCDATELGAQAVSVFPCEDRKCEHVLQRRARPRR
jgi:pyruvate carboxylase